MRSSLTAALAVGLAWRRPQLSHLPDITEGLKAAESLLRNPNAHTDALGAALEEALRIASDEMDEVFGGDMRARDTAIVVWNRQARAALEAWKART